MAQLKSTNIIGNLSVVGDIIEKGSKLSDKYVSSIVIGSSTDIGSVGTPSVGVSTSNGTTTLTFHNLKGAAGSNGNNGTNGTSAVWHTGTGITGTGHNAAIITGSGVTSATAGDMYLNTSTYEVYSCTSGGNASQARWTYKCNIKGATGAAGSNGSSGSNGTSAAWFTGTTVTGTSTTATSFTVSNSKAGDMYLNTSTANVYSATAANKWVYVCNIKGATGAAGSNGTTPTIKAANGTSIGVVGTPSVTASTNGTTTTFTFNNLKGEKGDPGTNATTTSVATTSANGLMSANDKTNLTYYVVGTQTAATGSWTGKLEQVSVLYEGLTIRYKLPYAGSGNASLNLTLAGGTTTGAIAIYRYGSTTRITTHFAAGSIITMTYNGTYWNVDAYYDTNTTYSEHVRGTTTTTGTTRYVLPAAAARQIHTWWRTSTDLYAKGNVGTVQTVNASAMYAMQSYGPTGNTSAAESTYGPAISTSSGMFGTTLNAMGGSSWVTPALGDYVIDPYGCIGVIESNPLGTTLQTSYPVRIVYKSNTKWNYTCVEEGTLITLSDGSQVPVETLDQGDLIMGYDFEANKPCEAVTLFARATQQEDRVTYMIFSNGEYLTLSHEHEIYSKTHGRYMFISDLHEGDIVLGKDGEDVEIMSMHRDIWTFGRKQFYQVVSSNNTYYANNILNAMHPINKFNWVHYGLMQEIPQEIMEIFIEDAREFNCYEFLVKDKEFLKQAVNIQREMKLRSNRIDELKAYLTRTDYVALKHAEGEVVDGTIIIARQDARVEINQLEAELATIYQPEYNKLLSSHALIGEDILLSDEEKRVKYFKLACKRDNENLALFKQYYPVPERTDIDWETYQSAVIVEETEEEPINE